MDSSFNTRIPHDILISIIDQLAFQGCFESLRACSRTCRMLLHQCYTHLFSTITIIHNNATQFAALLHRNPKIQGYVRELYYEPSISSEVLAKAFLLLSSVKTLSLQGRCGASATLCSKWCSLPPHMQHALGHLFGSPSVTHIRLYHFTNVPAILLSSCSNLRHLDINRSTSFTSKTCNTPLLAPPKPLSLNIAKALGPAMKKLLIGRRVDGLPMLDLSSLQSLTTTIRMMHESADDSHLEQILRSTPKLEHLDITVPFEVLITDSFAQTLTIALPALRSLKMEWNLRHINDVIFSVKFPGLINVLQALAYHPNCINEISIILKSRWPRTFTDQDWERIDQVLADRFAFQRLQKLNIKFCVPRYLSHPDNLGKNQFQEFRATKLLRLSSANGDHLDFQFILDDDPDSLLWLPHITIMVKFMNLNG